MPDPYPQTIGKLRQFRARRDRLSRDGHLCDGKARRTRLQLDRTGFLRRAHNHERSAVEQLPLGSPIRLKALAVSVAQRRDFARTGYRELNFLDRKSVV